MVPADVPRFKEVGAVGNYTPYWLCCNSEVGWWWLWGDEPTQAHDIRDGAETRGSASVSHRVSLAVQMETTIAPSLGPPERVQQQYPIADMLKLGVPVSFGSDWPVCW